jgi:hypothetical protein
VGGVAAYAEARHRGAPFGMAVSHLVHPPFEADWEALRVTLKRTSGIHADVRQLARAINADIASIVKSVQIVPALIETNDYTIEHLRGDEPRTLHFRYGSEQPYAGELEQLVYRTLEEKSTQLTRVASQGRTTRSTGQSL